MQLLAEASLIGLLVILSPSLVNAQTVEQIDLARVIQGLERCKNTQEKCGPAFARELVGKIKNLKDICYQITPEDRQQIRQAGDFIKANELENLMRAIEAKACPTVGERVRISLLNYNCNKLQTDSIAGPLNDAFLNLLDRFSSGDDLSKHVAKLNLVEASLSQFPSYDQIEIGLKNTDSLYALQIRCPEDPKSDNPYLISHWFLGKLRGGLDRNIKVTTRWEYIDFWDENGLPNLFALYALARDAQLNGHTLAAIAYLTEAHESATCKINDFANKEKYEGEIFKDSIAQGLESKQKQSKIALEEIQKGKSDVMMIKAEIRKMLVEELKGTPPSEACSSRSRAVVK
ncbi:MAG TPA: hypothetical protein VGN86_12075 [Pyrinomonadaceae bacterium]|nr:hypothetical protein [Pyrinomonadaceae bacterium]